MIPSDDYRRGAADRTLAVRTRGDLQAVATPLDGRAWYVVADPVTGESFHFSPEEYALLEALREPTTLRRLQQMIEERFPPRRASILTIQQFVSRIYDQGLAVSEHPEQGRQLLKRGRTRRRRERWSRLGQILSIKLYRFSPGPAIDWLYRRLRWFCTPTAVIVAAALVLAAIVSLLAGAPELVRRLPAARELMQPRYLVVWLAAIGAVKVCHELGHALACRTFGCRPREAGLLLLAGAPALYCDTSDAWRLPSKRQRMIVSAAGMGVELVLASIAALVWLWSPPGLTSTVCLSLIIVCSVGTLAINANPLLRYDGYYLLADWWEVPNLAERSRGLVTSAWRGWLLGEPAASDSLLGKGKQRALVAYAALATAYVAVMLVTIITVFTRLAKPHGLENLVYLAGAVLVGAIGYRAAASAGHGLADPATRAHIRWPRALTTFAVLAAVVCGILMIPISRRVKAPALAVPGESHPLFALAAGELTFAKPAGSRVAKGETVARLANPELELSLIELEGKVRELRVRVAQLRTLQATLPAAAQMLPTTEAELADAAAQVVEQQRLVNELTIHSPADGTLLPPPDEPLVQRDSVRLASWHGQAIAPRNHGAWLEAGKPLAVVVGDREPWRVWGAVDEADAPSVAPGQEARVALDLAPDVILTGRVVQISQRARSNRSTDAEAPLPGETSLGQEPYHVVEIELDPTETPLVAGARGTGKITVEKMTLGQLALFHLRRALERVF